MSYSSVLSELSARQACVTAASWLARGKRQTARSWRWHHSIARLSPRFGATTPILCAAAPAGGAHLPQRTPPQTAPVASLSPGRAHRGECAAPEPRTGALPRRGVMSSTEGATAYAAGVSAVPAVCMMLGSLLLMRAQISAKVQAVFQARAQTSAPRFWRAAVRTVSAGVEGRPRPVRASESADWSARGRAEPVCWHHLGSRCVGTVSAAGQGQGREGGLRTGRGICGRACHRVWRGAHRFQVRGASGLPVRLAPRACVERVPHRRRRPAPAR